MRANGPRLTPLLLFVAVTLAVAALGSLWLTRNETMALALDRPVLQALWRVRPLLVPTEARVIIVAIDAGSIEREGQWPWPRAKLARLVQRLSAAGAAVIGFPILFEAPTDAGNDAAFLDAMARTRRVVLGSAGRPAPRPLNAFPDAAREPFGIGSIGFRFDALDGHSAVGIVAAHGVAGERYPPFPVVMATRAGRAVVDDVNDFFINFCGPAGTFQSIPAHRVLAGHSQFDIARLSGNAVIVSVDLPFGIDTPLGTMSMSEVYANGVETVLRGNRLHFSWPMTLVLTPLVAAGTFLAVERRLMWLLPIGLGYLGIYAAVVWRSGAVPSTAIVAMAMIGAVIAERWQSARTASQRR